MTVISIPVGKILTNDVVSPWKEHCDSLISSSPHSSPRDDSVDASHLNDKELIEAVKNYYPFVKNVEIKKYDTYRVATCYFENDFLKKACFDVRDSSINHPYDRISMGGLFDDNRYCSEIYKSRRDFLEKVCFALRTRFEVVYYVVDKKGKIVTPYYANKKLAEKWISKQPTTKKWLWFELKNNNFEIKRKIVYIKDGE